MLARQARRLINLVDDTPIVPGNSHPAFDGYETGQQILTETEEELKTWRATYEPVKSSAGTMGVGGMPALPNQQGVQADTTMVGTDSTGISATEEPPATTSNVITTESGVKIETT